MPEYVRITDVSPRDGLQNEPGVIPTEAKLELIDALFDTGVDEIEITSFVSPKWIPQLADASEVCAGVRGLLERQIKKTPLSGPPPEGEGVSAPVLSALVPNETGFARFLAARQAGVPLDKIALFTAASETFNQKNLNTTFTGTMQRFAPIIVRASCPIRGYVSCAIACPFEGPIDPVKVHACAFHLYDNGIEEIDLGDTIGAGTPNTVTKLLETVFTRMKEENATPIITLHLHDTFGRAADCVKAALDCGVRSFDGSVAGLGGCPYASTPGKRAPGNIATETLVRTIEDAGFRTGVDLDALARAGKVARRVVSEARSVGEGPLTRLGSAETPSPPRGEGG